MGAWGGKHMGAPPVISTSILLRSQYKLSSPLGSGFGIPPTSGQDSPCRSQYLEGLQVALAQHTPFPTTVRSNHS